MRRREFLEKTLIGSAGIAIGSSGLFMASCRGANEKIVLAIIGAGKRGVPSVISCCKINKLVEIKTVCDVNDLKSAFAAGEIEKQLGYKPQTTRNMKDVFADKDVDAVWIATPDHWHALATILACQAGKDVYVEKTPSGCIWESSKMAEAEKKYKRIVQVGLQNRSGAYIAGARDYISTGKLGQVVHIRVYNLMGGTKWVPMPDSETPYGIDWNSWLGPSPLRPFNAGVESGWNNYWAYGTGALSFACHQLDIARMLMGDPGHPKSVLVWGGNHIWDSECETPEFQSITFDYEKFTMTCDSGNTTNYMTNTPNDLPMDPTRFPKWKTNADRIEIYGSLGVMYIGITGGGWQVFGLNEKIVAQAGGIDPDKEHQINFIESVRSRKQPNSTIGQAHLSASLVHFANISYRTGNKQLLIDGQNEKFIDNDDANKLLKLSYRDQYIIPEKV